MQAHLSEPADRAAPMQFGADAVHQSRRAAAPILTLVGSGDRMRRRLERPSRPYTGPSGPLIVELVRCFVAAHIGHPLDATVLVNATAVSESTLRRAVHAETGMRLSGFILQIRLDQARAWLSTNREARSQEEIARALSYKSPAALARSYRQRFGESMSETRWRAVSSSKDL
jgi:transcriptional regulator GlxA family with amidase domain